MRIKTNRHASVAGRSLLLLFFVLLSPARVIAYDNFENSKQWEETRIEVNPNEQTGAFTLSYPITAPPGRIGLEPDIILTYNSQSKENTNLLGYGWSINIPYIARVNKQGVPTLYEEYNFTSSFDGELATTTAGTSDYGAKVENGNFFTYEFTDNSWTATDKRGTVYTFGTSTASRLYDTGTTTTRIFKWMLSEVRDRNDNHITYYYTRDSNQLYPSRITYTGNGSTNGIFDVEFTLESRNDSLASYATGFSVVSNYRISEIKTEVNNSWVRKYVLSYITGDNDVRSLLASITETGRDEDGNTLAMPATTFGYSTSTKSWTKDTDYYVPSDFVSTGYVDSGLRIMDINRDGLPDLVKGDEAVFLNNGDGTGWATSTQFSGPTRFITPPSDRVTRIMEINGDGLLDIARSMNASTSVYLTTAYGTGWSAPTGYTIPLAFEGTSPRDIGVRVMDVDGDGLHDLVHSAEGETPYVYLNNGDGTGWATTTGYSVPFQFASTTGYGWAMFVIDYNADGLPDLAKQGDTVYLDKGDGTGWVSGNISVFSGYSNFPAPAGRAFDANGDGLPELIRADTNNQVLTNDGDGTGWSLDNEYTIIDFVEGGGNDAGVREADVNGDGLPDLIKAIENSSANEVYIKNGVVADLLTTVKDSKGATTTVTYKGSPQYVDGSGDLRNPRLPLVLQMVDSIVTSDNLGNGTSATYTYGDGLYYYASEYDNEFAGFATTTKTDASGFVTNTYFHQGTSTNANIGKYSDHISKRGKPYRSEVYDPSGNLYSKIITQWDRADLGGGRNFVKKAREVRFSYDGDADHKDSATTYTYDNSTGNLTYQLEYGEVTGSDDGTFTDTGTDKFATTITYAASTTLNLYLPSQETVVDSASTTVKDTKHYYDSLAQGSVDKGNETKTEFWKTGSSWIDTERTFNSYGLITQEKDSRDNATTLVYDGYNLNVATSTNAKSHITEFYRDFSSGKVKETVDPNSLHFTTTFDAFDRPVTEKQPDLTTPSTLATTTTFAYTDTRDARKIVKTKYLSTATTSDTYTYLDGFDRVLQERSETENGNYVVRDFLYDAHGLLHKESLPYFSSSTPRTATTTNMRLYTVYAYDPLHRATSTATAVGTTTRAYDQWEEVVTDTRGNPKDFHRNAYGRLASVEEHTATSTYTTSYEYNYLGNLTKITDALGNIRNFTYDGLGRRTAAGDLHALTDTSYGTTTYTYDPAGNLATSTDPKSQTVEYSYDSINRVLTEDYTGAAGTEVIYVYDGCTYGVGRLCGSTTTDAGTNFLYNALGLTQSERKTIDSAAYTTAFSYDRQGNQTAVTYPDGAVVQYAYNDAGQLEAVSKKESGAAIFTSAVSNFNYAPTGQLSLIHYGNDVITENTYDADELYRLRTKITQAPVGGEGGMGGFGAPPGMSSELFEPFAFSGEGMGLLALGENESEADEGVPLEVQAILEETVSQASASYTPPPDTADSIDDFTALMESAQTDYFADHGRYFQGLPTHDEAPSDTTAANWSNRLDDQAQSWTDLGIALPQQTPFKVVSNVYDGPQGKGWQLVYSVKDGNTIYSKAVGYGPDTSARSWNWAEVYTQPTSATSTAARFFAPIARLFSAPFAHAGNNGSSDFESGNTEYLSISDGSQTGLDITGDFTCEAWIKMESQGVHTICGKFSSNQGYYFYWRDDGDTNDYFQVCIGNGSASCKQVFSLNQATYLSTWTHVAVAYDASADTFEGFINGTSVGTSPTFTVGAPVNSSAEFHIGEAGANYTDALFDDVRVWNDKRTTTELSSNKENCFFPASSANLVSWWKLDESSGTRVDQTSNHNHLTDNNTVTGGTAAYTCTNAQVSTVTSSDRVDSATNATLNGTLDFIGDSANIGFTYAIDSNFASAATTTTQTATTSVGSYSSSVSGLTTFEEYGFKAWVSTSGPAYGYGDVYQFFTADLSTSTPVVTADNHVWDLSTFDNGTHSGTVVNGTDLKLSGSAPYANGSWTSPAWNLASIDYVDTSFIEYSATTPSDTSVVVKTAVNTSATSSPTAASFATSTSGGTIAGVSNGSDLAGKYLWIKVELKTSSDQNSTPTFHFYKAGINNDEPPTSLLENFTYTYDSVGNITQILDNSDTDAAKISAFTYDTLNRLTYASTTDLSGGQGGLGGFDFGEPLALLLGRERDSLPLERLDRTTLFALEATSAPEEGSLSEILPDTTDTATEESTLVDVLGETPQGAEIQNSAAVIMADEPQNSPPVQPTAVSIDEFTARMEEAQEQYYRAHSRYFQGLPNHTGVPAE